MVPPPLVNIDTFPEFDPHVAITSPRSLRACSEEGVAPQDLVYKTLDAFAERGLSPRLIKLRYDFFEAKRRDLLSSARRTRYRIIDDETRDPSKMQLQEIAEQNGVHAGHLLALQGDTLKRERLKLLRSQQLQKGWLKNTLLNELRQCQALEHADKKLTAEGNNKAEEALKHAARLKEINDRRAGEEERKRLETIAQEKYEKQMAKEECARQQEEQEKLKEKQREEDKLRNERSRIEQEKQFQREREKEEKRLREYDLQQHKLEALQEKDENRLMVLSQKAQQTAQDLVVKKVYQEDKIKVSQRNLAVVEEKKRLEFADRQIQEEERDRKLALNRALQQEEGAKRSFQLMMKRKQIADDAQKKMDDRRQALTQSRVVIEQRLQIHDVKKARYLDFKRELDALKEKNKEINVTRQRRKEEHSRLEIQETIEKKTAKSDAVRVEREALWGLRRTAGIVSQGARESIKDELTKMKIRSKPDPKILEKHVQEFMANEMFDPRVIQQSQSMPKLANSKRVAA